MLNEKEYTKIDMYAASQPISNLIEQLKKAIPDSQKEEFYKNLTKVYVEIDNINKSFKINIPNYDETKFSNYIHQLISGYIAVGFDVYIKECNSE